MQKVWGLCFSFFLRYDFLNFCFRVQYLRMPLGLCNTRAFLPTFGPCHQGRLGCFCLGTVDYFIVSSISHADLKMRARHLHTALWLAIVAEKSALKGQCHEIFCFWFFFMNQFPPQPQSIPVGPFQIFSKNRGDILKSRCTTGINDNGGVLLIPVANLPPESTIPVSICHRYRWLRWQIATGINDTCGKFATGVVDTGGKQWEQYQAADTLKWTWRQKFICMLTLLSKGIPTKLFKFSWLKIFSFAIGVNDTGGQPLAANISANFRKIRNGPNGILRGLGETDSW